MSKVFMVSAGPGVADHLTVRAKKILSQADLVAYDDLIHPSILELAPCKAHLHPIGYRSRAGSRHPILSPQILHWAHWGKKVVRLKGGDASTFSRIYEEAQMLAKESIGVEIIPGVSTGFSAAADLGFPLTRKGVASQICVEYSGSLKDDNRPTRLMYMPRANIASYCLKLIELGYPPETPAVFASCVGTPLSQNLAGNLKTLPSLVQGFPKSHPGIVLVGQTMEASMIEPHHHPLAGLRLLILRLRRGPSTLGEKLRELGADVVYAPRVNYATETLPDPDRFRAILENEDSAVLITTEDEAEFFTSHMQQQQIDFRQIRCGLISFGQKSKARLIKSGLIPDYVIPGYRTEAISKALGGQCFQELAHFGMHSEAFQKQIEPYCHCDVHIPLYRKWFDSFRIVSPPPDAIFAPSASALDEFHSRDFGFDGKDRFLFCMGESIRAKALKLGYSKAVVLNSDDKSELLSQINQQLRPPHSVIDTNRS